MILAATPRLKTVDAAGDVSCIIREATGNRSIDCQKLHLTADQGDDGSVLAKTIDATGDVHAVDNDRDLRSEVMRIWLTDKKPTTRELASNQKNDRELEKLIARHNVHVTRKDGSEVTGDALTVEMTNGQPHVLITAEKQAVVSNPTSKLIGTWIELWNAEQRGIVKGPGRMVGTMKQTSNSPGRPMDVTWSDGVTLDGVHDRINVNGNVSIVSTDTNGAHNTATGKRMVLLLAKMPEKPTTQAATAPSRTGAVAVIPSSSQPTTRKKPTTKKSPDEQLDFLSGKDVTQVQILENVKVDSVLGDDKGNLWRQVSIRSEELDYDRINDTTTIPVPGKLLFVDLKPTTRPTTATSQPETMASSKGKTAMEWSKSLVYDEKNKLATMTGDVIVRHQGLKNSDDYDISADKIVTELAEAKTKSDDFGGQVHKVTADGNVHFAAKGKKVDASTVDYDPTAEILVATGSDRLPAEVFNAAGEPQGTFGRLRYDVRSGKIEKLEDFRGTLRVKEKITPGQQPQQPAAPTGAPSLIPGQDRYNP